MPRVCCLCAKPLSRIEAEAVNCSKCENIFHRTCVSVDIAALPTALLEFTCTECDINNTVLESSTSSSILAQLQEMQNEVASIKILHTQSNNAIKNVEMKLCAVTNLAQEVTLNTTKINAANKSISELQYKVNQLCTFEKAKQLVVTGLPHSKAENLRDVKSIAAAIGLTISTDVIDKCFRFRPRSGNIKPVLVTFSSTFWRDKMLSAFRSRKKPLAGGDLGLDPSVKLIIGEHL